MAADKRKALSYLNQVHVTLSKDDETTKRNRAVVDDVLEVLIKHMKEQDPLFSKAFKRITYTGSSFEGLRIREADEFDVNLIISLPIRNDEFKLAAVLPGFVSYTLTGSGRNSLRCREGQPVLQRLDKLFDKSGKLLAQNFRTWFQSVVDQALQSYKSSNDKSSSFKVRPSQSGPAKTLYVFLDNGKRIDIDLVPVLEFNYNLLPANFPRYKWIKKYCEEIDKRWVMVPKTPKDKKNSGMVHAWRIHFPDIEKKLIKDFGCVKPITRLVKALRDAYEWPLSSYAIKTVVVRHRLSKPNKSDWENEHQWTLLLEVLERLHEELLSNKGISYLFDEKMNLVHDLKPVTRENIAGCLKKQVLNKLSQSPENALEVFKIQDSALIANPVLTKSRL
ncbi:cyclic GMP-AMP synthase-like receptor [Haemaphysalis longicornis]